MRDLWLDLRFAATSFLRNPAFTLTAIASIVLGIGANTAIFTLLDAVFRRPLPVEEPHRLVKIYETVKNDAGEDVGARAFSYPNYLDYKERNRSLGEIALYHSWPVNLAGGDEPLRAAGLFVTASYFDVLGLEPAAGRFFAAGTEAPGSAPSQVVLSHGCWLRFFGADPDIVGRQVLVNGEKLVVTGVTPRGFRGTDLDLGADVFLPILTFKRLSPWSAYFDVRSAGIFFGLGRLRPDVTPAAAAVDLQAVARQLSAEHGDELAGLGGRVLPLLEATTHPRDRGRYVGYARTLGLAVTAILLVTCLNVAALLLVRDLGRARELAVRQALGAGRWRLLRQLLSENLLLFLVGGLLSLPAAGLFLQLLWRLRPPSFPATALDLRLDGTVFAVTLATSLAAGLAVGLLSAGRALLRLDLAAGLKGAAPAPWPGRTLGLRHAGLRHAGLRHASLRHAVVVAQIALTLVALIAAGLFLRTVQASQAIDLGFDTDRLMVLSTSPGEQGYDAPQTRGYYRRLLARVRSVPGVDAAALSQNRLLRGAPMQRQIFPARAATAAEIGGRNTHRTVVVSTGFFATAGIALVAGRDFGDRDLRGGERDDVPVAIVNETMAHRVWPGAGAVPGASTAIGRHFRFDFPDSPLVEVVGVVADARYRNVREADQFFVYLPLAQNAASSMVLHARTARDPNLLVGPVRRAAQALDPSLPLADAGTLRHFVDEALWLERVSATLLSLYALVAMALSMIGVYGLLAYSAGSRRRELGILQALGARRVQVLGVVLAEAVRLASAGVVAGLLLAFFVLRPAIASQIYGVDGADPATYVLAATALLAGALLGGILPAWRAARADPFTALRTDS